MQKMNKDLISADLEESFYCQAYNYAKVRLYDGWSLVFSVDWSYIGCLFYGWALVVCMCFIHDFLRHKRHTPWAPDAVDDSVCVDNNDVNESNGNNNGSKTVINVELNCISAMW